MHILLSLDQLLAAVIVSFYFSLKRFLFSAVYILIVNCFECRFHNWAFLSILHFSSLEYLLLSLLIYHKLMKLSFWLLSSRLPFFLVFSSTDYGSMEAVFVNVTECFPAQLINVITLLPELDFFYCHFIMFARLSDILIVLNIDLD